ncbi:MAG: FAD-binding oxidoreductase [Polyangiales bacterium]
MERGAALSAMRSVVGDAFVERDDVVLRRLAVNTLGLRREIAAVVRPGSLDEVRGCLRAAALHGAPVYPVSRGRNWGLGSRAPVTDGCVLLDLGRMTAIADYDEAMGTVTVEPGVSFAQLYAFLRERASPWFVPVTGSSPEASVVGNAIERGDGVGVDGDRASRVCDLEAVLSTGEVIRTGFSRFEGARAAGTHRWGVGPSLDGLLSQSNLAVVTRATLWLSRLPRSIHALRFAVRATEDLSPLVDALRALRAEGTLRSTAGLWNALRVRSTVARYPYAAAGGVTPLPPSLRDDVVREMGGCAWHGLTGIYAADESIGAALRERAASVLAPVVDHWSAEERVGDARAGHELLWETEPAFGSLQGVPHEESLRSAYWRMRDAPTHGLDPDRDGCGVIWMCPLVPWRGEDVVRVTSRAEATLPAEGFEAMLAVISQSERSAYVVPSIFFDRGVDGEAERAMAAHDALLSEMVGDGYLPYRLGVHSMGALSPSKDDTDVVLRRIKSAMDPSGVIAPGRYER